MRRFRILTFLLCISMPSIGQFDLQTSKIYGGNATDDTKDLAFNDSHTIMFFGSRTFSTDGDVPANAGSSDFWIMKRNVDGSLIWSKTYGGLGTDDLVTVMPHSDGGVLAFGTTHTNQGAFGEILGLAGGWLMRTNTNGTLIAGKIFGGNITEIAVDAFRHVNGNVTMALEAGSTTLNGQTNHGITDVWIVRVNALLDIQWSALLGGTGADVPAAITSDIGGNVYIAATSNSNLPGLNPNQGGKDVWIIKLGPNGDVLWQKSFGGTDDDIASDILIHPDGFLYIMAHSSSADHDFATNAGLNDIWMIKLNEVTGETQYLKRFGGSGNDFNPQLDVFGDQHLVICASTTSDDLDLTGNKGLGDVWIINTDLDGQIIKQMNYGGSLNETAVDIVTIDTVFHVLTSSFSSDKNVPNNTLSQQDLWYFTLNTQPDSCSDQFLCQQDSILNNQLFPPSDDILLCVAGCTAGYGPGPDFTIGSCPDFSNPTAYYYVTTDDAADLLTLSVTSNEFNQPQIALLRSVNCISFQQVSCASGTDGSVLMPYIDIEPLTTYVIAISDVEGNIGGFELCVTAIDVEFCNLQDRIFVTQTSQGSPLNGPYKPGEEVQICYELQDWAKLSCNGFQGLVPTFGPGWDTTWFGFAGQPLQIDSMIIPVEEGFWQWYQLGDVRYNISNPVNGYDGGQGMPAGWYFTNTGDPPPTNDPDDTTGDINNCLPTPDTWKVCFTLKVVDECESNIDCTVSFKTFADGEIGSNWSLACVYDQEEVFNAYMLCCLNPTVDPIQDFSVCSGDTIRFSPETNLIPPVTYSWTANPDPFIEGATPGNDAFQFFQVLSTNAVIPLKVRYSLHAEGNSCQTGDEDFEITVLPLPTSRITLTGPNIVCSGSTVTFNFESTGTPPFAIGLYRDNKFFANVLSESNILTIDIDPVFSGKFRIGTLSDAFCEGIGTGFVNVTVKPESAAIIDTALCEGEYFIIGVDTFSENGTYTVTLDNAAANNCDSTVVLSLSIIPSLTETIDEVICQGDTLFVLGEPYTETTDEIIEYIGPLGCPDYIHLILLVKDTFTSHIEQTICNGDTLNFEGILVYQEGTYSHVEEIRPGCFEETILHLSVLPAITINDLAIIADNGFNNGAILVEILGGTPPFTYLWNTGQTTESLFNIMYGIYTQTVTDQVGCLEVFTYEVPMISGSGESPLAGSAIKLWPSITTAGNKIQLINLNPVTFHILSVDWLTQDGRAIHALDEVILTASEEIQISVPLEFPAGIYPLKIQLKSGQIIWARVIVL